MKQLVNTCKLPKAVIKLKGKKYQYHAGRRHQRVFNVIRHKRRSKNNIDVKIELHEQRKERGTIQNYNVQNDQKRNSNNLLQLVGFLYAHTITSIQKAAVKNSITVQVKSFRKLCYFTYTTNNA